MVTKSRCYLKIVNVRRHGSELNYWKYSNQSLKFIFPILVMLVALIWVFHMLSRRKNYKCNERFFFYIITGHEKLDTVKQYWWCDKWNLLSQIWSSFKADDAVYIMWLDRNNRTLIFFWRTNQINMPKCCSWLGPVITAINKMIN